MKNKGRVAKCLFAALIAALLATGCSGSLQTENEKLNTKNAQAEAKIAEQAKQIDTMTEQIDKLQSDAPQVPVSTEMFPLYTMDVNDMQQEVGCYIAVPESSDLKTKLTAIAGKVSEFYFSSLPIKVTEIDGQNIAHIDLQELGSGKISWAQTYFQGSTGGTITTTQLVQSFLQKDYKGDWIAGVQFTYKGKPIEFEHVPDLAGVIKR